MSANQSEVRDSRPAVGAGARAEQGKEDHHWPTENRCADMQSMLEALTAEIGVQELVPIVEQFSRDVLSCLESLRLACEAHDQDALQRQRHRLKGLLQQMGATDALDVLLDGGAQSALRDTDWLANLERLCTGATHDARRIIACHLSRPPR